MPAEMGLKLQKGSTKVQFTYGWISRWINILCPLNISRSISEILSAPSTHFYLLQELSLRYWTCQLNTMIVTIRAYWYGISGSEKLCDIYTEETAIILSATLIPLAAQEKKMGIGRPQRRRRAREADTARQYCDYD